MKIKWTIVLLTILLGLIIGSRFFQLGSNPISLYWDELAIGIDSYLVSETGKDISSNHWLQAIYPSYGDYKAPLAILLSSISIDVFGLSAFSLRLSYAIMSFIGLIGIWLLIKELFALTNFDNSKIVNYLTVFFLATTPWHFHFSRIGFESSFSFNILILGLLFLIKGLRTHGSWLLLAAIFGGLNTYAYFSARFITPIFFITTLFLFLSLSWKRKWWLIVSIFLFVLIQIPLLSSPHYSASQQFRWSADNVISDGKSTQLSSQLILESNNTLFSRLIYHRYWTLARAYFDNYLEHFNINFLFVNGDSNLRHHSGWGGELLLFSAPLFILGLYWLLKNLHRSLAWLIIIWLLISPVTAGFPYEVPHASRSIYMLLPLAIILTFGAQQLLNLLTRLPNSMKTYRNITSQYFLTGLIIIGISGNFFLFLEDYFNHYPSKSSKAWQVENYYIAKAVNKYSSENQDFIISAAYRLPILSILFHNPELIMNLQSELLTTSQAIEFFIQLQSFQNMSFIDHEIKVLQEDQYYLLPPDDNHSKWIQEEYLYSNGESALQVFKKTPE